MLDRLRYPTDPNEMQRRWDVTLAAMDECGIDCLIFSGHDRVCSGPSKYLTDMIVCNYPHFFLFSKEGIACWGQGDRGQKLYGAYHEFSNVYHSEMLPFMPAVTFGTSWIPEEILTQIEHFGFKKIGLLGMYNIPAGLYKYLVENLSNVEFVDFTDKFDHIKAVKSEYELKIWQDCVDLHDQLFKESLDFIRPGMMEWEISHLIRSRAEELGCLDLNVMLGSDPKIPKLVHFPYQNKRVEKGDYLQLLIEVAGHGGCWAEVGRVISLGEPSETMIKACKDQVIVQSYVASNAKPGVAASDVFVKMNEMLKNMGYLPEKRFAVHGQGYDIVDRPLFVAEETMILKENMFFANHPTVANGKVSLYNCDNFVVKKDGAIKLSSTESKLFVID